MVGGMGDSPMFDVPVDAGRYSDRPLKSAAFFRNTPKGRSAPTPWISSQRYGMPDCPFGYVRYRCHAFGSLPRDGYTAHSMLQPPADPASAPILTYAPPRRGGRLRRWLRPGSPGFFLLILLLAGAGTWGGWKWRLRADERAFDQCVTIGNQGYWVKFTAPPTRAAVRHLARRRGPLIVTVEWTGPSEPAAFEAFRGMPLANVSELGVHNSIAADALIKEIARPGSGLKALTLLHLPYANVTDAGLKELSRPDSGLKSLTTLYVVAAPVTDAGLKELSRPDTGLKALDALYLWDTPVTDAGLREMSRPESGLKALTKLDLQTTRVTDAGLMELCRPDSGLKALKWVSFQGTPVTIVGVETLAKARPGLKISHWNTSKP